MQLALYMFVNYGEHPSEIIKLSKREKILMFAMMNKSLENK